MRKHIHTILFFWLVKTGFAAAQTSTGSLYSAMGVGQIEANGSGKTKMLGGTGIGLKSEGYLNNTNPASFGSIEELRFIFEGGFEGSMATYTSNDLTQKYTSANFNYLAIGFQFSEWWKSSFGMKPFSHVGYNVTTSKYIEGTTATYNTYYTGSGDVSQLYWSSAFVPLKNLYLGVNFSYLFGNIKREEKVIAPVTLTEEILTSTKYVNAFYTDFGFQYTLERDKFDYTIGAIYGPSKQFHSTSEFAIINSYDTLRTETIEDVTKYSLPQKAGVGFSLSSKSKNFKLAVDYKWEEWEKVKLDNADAYFKNSNRFSLGVEFVPKKTLNDPYLRQIRYMLGSYFTDTNIEYNGTPVQEMGLTLGFGLPLRGGSSYLNMGFEGGYKGITQQGLIREDYVKIHLSFTLSDTWFQKYKFK